MSIASVLTSHISRQHSFFTIQTSARLSPQSECMIAFVKTEKSSCSVVYTARNDALQVRVNTGIRAINETAAKICLSYIHEIESLTFNEQFRSEFLVSFRLDSAAQICADLEYSTISFADDPELLSRRLDLIVTTALVLIDLFHDPLVNAAHGEMIDFWQLPWNIVTSLNEKKPADIIALDYLYDYRNFRKNKNVSEPGDEENVSFDDTDPGCPENRAFAAQGVRIEDSEGRSFFWDGMPPEWTDDEEPAEEENISDKSDDDLFVSDDILMRELFPEDDEEDEEDDDDLFVDDDILMKELFPDDDETQAV